MKLNSIEKVLHSAENMPNILNSDYILDLSNYHSGLFGTFVKLTFL